MMGAWGCASIRDVMHVVRRRCFYSCEVIEWSSPWYGYDNVDSRTYASFLGETISNCDTSKLGLLSYESTDFRERLP